MDSSAFALFGPGRLGLRLALRLIGLGWRCTAVRDLLAMPEIVRRRLPEGTLTDDWDSPLAWELPRVVFLTVPDSAIESTASRIAAAFDVTGRTILPTSGLITSDALAACGSRGGLVASWHPLQSFPPLDRGTVRWEGVPCAIEGAAPAVEIGFDIALALGLRPWRIDPAVKPLYHASASVAANLTHILVARAAELISRCGAPTDGAAHPLLLLVETSVRAALEAPDLGALTGPIARGDSSTIDRHLRVLPPRLAAVYTALREVAEAPRRGSTP